MLTIVGSGDTVNAVSGGTQSAPVLDDSTVSDIDAVYDTVLDRDPTASELITAQTELATGVGLNGLMSTLANSAEMQADMTSTFEAASGAYQSLMTAQPQSNEEQTVTSIDPTQAEFNAFADVMSTSYGAPIEIVSFDPYNGAQTELADTSVTNLLAELPVLETEANGVNLGLKLADGTELQFASTARLTTFLYSVAVQQLQATQFVTDNYNLDMQWLNTVDQPLLQEAVFWSEAAAYFQPFDKVRAEELNIESSLALKIAGESPGSRQDLEQTINNPDTGNPTQITVYAAADGSRVHDVSGSIFGSVESLISTVLDIAAVVSGQDYLYFAAAALDAAEAGQAFSNGQDLAGILSFAQALSSGILGGTGGTTPLGTPSTAAPTVAQTTAQVISTAAQAVGGVYGVVQSAENGNGAGILAGALEAAAAAAAGIGIYEGGQTQATLNSIAAGLGAAGTAVNMGSDFASGNLAQGLVDSLNLFLPAVAAAYGSTQSTESSLQSVLNADDAAVAAEGASGAAPAGSSFAAQVPASQLISGSADSFTTSVQGQTETAEIGLVYTSPSSSTASGDGTGTIGIAVQPGVAGTNSTAPNGSNGSGGSDSDADFYITAPHPADLDTTTPTFGSLLLQAMQFIIPSAGAASPAATAAQQQARVATAESYLNNPNVQAFLNLIATAEGATYNSRYGDQLNGTRKTFNSYATFPQATSANTAEGRYQIVAETYYGTPGRPGESARLGLTDFSPHTQDIMAVDLLIQDRAIGPIVAGNLAGALAQASFTWAALPQSATLGSRYNQPFISYGSAVADFDLYRSQYKSP